jgi:hypothetical protein
MKIYIAVCCNRHTDDDIKLFTTAEAAIVYCQNFIRDQEARPCDVEEQDVSENWIYYCLYTAEGDSVRVEVAELEI